jgi:hypothetical protein
VSTDQDDFFAGPGSNGGYDSGAREPTAREVNRQLRAERKNEKAKLRKIRRGDGFLQPLIAKACSGKRAKSPEAQIDFLLASAEFIANTGRRRAVAERTMTIYGSSLRGAFGDLRAIGMPVWRVDSISRKHVIELVRHWIKEGAAAATIQNKVSHLRILTRGLGKPTLIPEDEQWHAILKSNNIDPARIRVTSIATQSKAWAANGVDAQTVIGAVTEYDELVGAQLLLELAFGARVKESHCLNPFTSDLGYALQLYDGTKGGRPRTVLFDPDPEVRAWQRNVLEQVKEIAKKHSQRKLAKPGCELAQAMNHYYYVVRKFGISRSGLGVTSHGLRHQYMHARYEAISGLPAPVLGQMPADVYRANPDAVREASRDVSAQAGHWRESVSGAYNSTPITMSRLARREQKASLALFQDRDEVAALFETVGTREVWLTGRASMGIPLADGEPITLVVLVRENLSPELETAFCASLCRLVGKAVTALFTCNVNARPPESVEVILANQLGSNGKAASNPPPECS